MTKDDLLSVLNSEFSTDILDSTEYLRRVFSSSINKKFQNSDEAELVSLRFTQDLTQELMAIAPQIDVNTWVLHEIETIAELYRNQVLQGANACIAQTNTCSISGDMKAQMRHANTQALLEAENNDALFFLGDLAVSDIDQATVDSVDGSRKAKLALLDQINLFHNQGAHGVWISLDCIEARDIIYEALRLADDIPSILSIDSNHLEQLCNESLMTTGMCVRFKSLIDVVKNVDNLVSLKDHSMIEPIIEIEYLGMVDHEAYDAIVFLKQKGMKHFRPGKNMSRNERVLLYSFV